MLLLLLLLLAPASPDALWNRGTQLYDRNQFRESEATFLKFVAIEPKAAAGWAFLGLCEFENRAYPNSLTHLQRALRIGLPEAEPLSKVTRYHAALVLTLLGHFESAVQLFGQLAVLDAGDRETVIATGLAGLRLPLLPSALPAGKEEFAFDVGHAMRETSARRAASGKTEFESLLTRYPDAPELHYLFGESLLNADPDQALVQWKREIEISPKHVHARLQIAFEYLKRGDSEAAAIYAREAASIDPESFAAHNALGRSLVNSGEVEQGVSELERARDLAPNSPETRIALASAYAKIGRPNDAKREREEFVRLRNQH